MTSNCSHKDHYFDREICPAPCDSMHYRCKECGATLDPCPFEELDDG